MANPVCKSCGHFMTAHKGVEVKCEAYRCTCKLKPKGNGRG